MINPPKEITNPIIPSELSYLVDLRNRQPSIITKQKKINNNTSKN